ncbi:hypothetical protein QYF48_16210 [Brevibacillus agri]|uniref:hypothetical protein n=1 Tax=Brevibacillus agri TaxID=51101 RepID=UPI0025B6AB67|nr:hypothetical protein [Brevibacillus agri]MDN4094353.1 hypothetical protein [Brevibacillus agri]
MAIFKPEIVNDEIRTGIKENTDFGAVAKVDYSLEGKKGETVTFVAYNPIGPVQDDRQDTDAVVFYDLSTNEFQVPIKEMVIGARVSDKDDVQGIGNPKNEATNQIRTAIANQIDTNIYKALISVPADRVIDVSNEATNNKFSYLHLAKGAALLKLEDAEDEALYFVHPDQVVDVVNDPTWQKTGTYNGEVLNTKLTKSEVGKINDIRVFKSDKIKKDENGVYHTVLTSKRAVSVMFQKAAKVTESYDHDYLKHKMSASTLYALAVVDNSKVAVLKTK